MRRVNISGIATVTFVVLVGGLLKINATALQDQRGTATIMAIASRQQVLGQEYLQGILLKARNVQADPSATHEGPRRHRR